MRRFISGICSNGKRLSDFLFDDIQQRFEDMAVMDITRCHDGGKEESIPVSGCVTGMKETRAYQSLLEEEINADRKENGMKPFPPVKWDREEKKEI